jgi:hypothetical protein
MLLNESDPLNIIYIKQTNSLLQLIKIGKLSILNQQLVHIST